MPCRQQEEMAAMVSATDAVRLRLPPLRHDTASSSQPQPAGDDLLRYVAGLDTSTVDQPDMYVPFLLQLLASPCIAT